MSAVLLSELIATLRIPERVARIAPIAAPLAIICPVTNAPCDRGCNPADGPCERQARDLAPSGYPLTAHGHDPAETYEDDSIVWLRQRAAAARREMIGLDFDSELRRYLTARASQADNEAAAREASMRRWNGRALQLRIKAAQTEDNEP